MDQTSQKVKNPMSNNVCNLSSDQSSPDKCQKRQPQWPTSTINEIDQMSQCRSIRQSVRRRRDH